jgi:hypothetical protein
VDVAVFNRPGEKLQHRMCIGFKVYVSQVCVDGMDGNAKLIGNIFSAPCLHNKLDDLLFPLGELYFFSIKHITAGIDSYLFVAF